MSIVWVAEAFTEEHRSVFDWINRSSNLRAFATEIQLVRIGDSVPAPQFKVVSKPNNWETERQRKVTARNLSGKPRQYMEFWKGFDRYVEGGPLVANGEPRPDYYRRFELGRPGFFLTAVVWHPRSKPNDAALIAELTILGANRIGYFSTLKRARSDVETRVGEELDWRLQKDNSQSVIASYGKFDGWDEEKWPAYYEWFKNKLANFHQTFRPLVMSA